MEKDLVIRAVQEYDALSISEKKVFIELLNIQVNYMVIASVKSISRQTNCPVPTIYSALKKLRINNYITKIDDQSHSYKLNTDKIEFIVNVYQNKKA